MSFWAGGMNSKGPGFMALSSTAYVILGGRRRILRRLVGDVGRRHWWLQVVASGAGTAGPGPSLQQALLHGS